MYAVMVSGAMDAIDGAVLALRLISNTRETMGINALWRLNPATTGFYH